MKRLVSILCVLSIYVSVYAQQEGEFTFRDALTGYAIVPDQLTFFNKEDDKVRAEFTQRDFVDSNIFKISLPEGQYELVLYKRGYKNIETRFSVEKTSSQNRVFELTPLIRYERNTIAFLESKKRADATVIIGTIVDERGFPIEGVEVFVSEDEKAVTSNTGNFELNINYRATHSTGIFRDIYYRKSGYQTIVSQDYFVMPNLIANQKQILISGDGELEQRTNDYYEVNGTFGGHPEHQIENEEKIYQAGSQANNSNNSNDCIPSSITVGLFSNTNFNCSCGCPQDGSNCGSCIVFVTLDLEEYVSRVIPAEWPTVWSTIPGVHDSYAAASVAIRTYAAYRVANPQSASYDIENATCDQKYSGPNPPMHAILAANATEGYILKFNGGLKKAEYSSENNNLSGIQCVLNPPNNYVTGNICGDGYVREYDPSSNCIEDPLGAGWVQFGHGRSMCQFCSVRWASGINIGFWCNNPSGFTVNSGPAHNLPKKTWRDMMEHYYGDYDLEECNCPLDRAISNTSIPSDLYLADNSITSENATVNSNANVTFRSPSIVLEDGFEAVPGSVFIGEFGNCTTTNFSDPNDSFSIVLDERDNLIVVLDNTKENNPFSYSLRDQDGKLVKENTNINNITTEFSISDLRNGEYQIVVTKSDLSFSKQIVLNHN